MGGTQYSTVVGVLQGCASQRNIWKHTPVTWCHILKATIYLAWAWAWTEGHVDGEGFICGGSAALHLWQVPLSNLLRGNSLTLHSILWSEYWIISLHNSLFNCNITLYFSLHCWLYSCIASMAVNHHTLFSTAEFFFISAILCIQQVHFCNSTLHGRVQYNYFVMGEFNITLACNLGVTV